jgi:hypothetical protein
MRDEIIAGIQNAMQRGESLEKAAQSFVNAGYNPQEVKAAVSYISEGVSEIVNSKETSHLPSAVPEAPEITEKDKHLLPVIPQKNEIKPQKKDGGMRAIILLIVFLIIVFVGALSYLIYYLLK